MGLCIAVQGALQRRFCRCGLHSAAVNSPPPPPHTNAHTAPNTLPQENLRQLCVFTMANATGRPYLWWDYVTLFGEQCVMETKQYGQECAEKVRLLCTVCTWRVAVGMPCAAGMH